MGKYKKKYNEIKQRFELYNVNHNKWLRKMDSRNAQIEELLKNVNASHAEPHEKAVIRNAIVVLEANINPRFNIKKPW